MTSRDEPGWRLVIPARGAPNGKSRLQHPERAALSRAFAWDTIAAAAAALGPAAVLVVTSDAEITQYADRLGARALADPAAGLNAAIAAGVAALGPGPVAALLGDVPAVRAQDIRTALDRSRDIGRAFVPDHERSGTVLLAAADGHLEPAFGAGSARRHREAGYRPVGLDLARLRRDVDVPDDLASVAALGCGRHTSAVLTALAPAPAS